MQANTHTTSQTSAHLPTTKVLMRNPQAAPLSPPPLLNPLLRSLRASRAAIKAGPGFLATASAGVSWMSRFTWAVSRSVRLPAGVAEQRGGSRVSGFRRQAMGVFCLERHPPVNWYKHRRHRWRQATVREICDVNTGLRGTTGAIRGPQVLVCLVCQQWVVYPFEPCPCED